MDSQTAACGIGAYEFLGLAGDRHARAFECGIAGPAAVGEGPAMGRLGAPLSATSFRLSSVAARPAAADRSAACRRSGRTWNRTWCGSRHGLVARRLWSLQPLRRGRLRRRAPVARGGLLCRRLLRAGGAGLELEAPAPDASASAGRPAVLAPAALQDFSSDGLSATTQDRRRRRCRSTQWRSSRWLPFSAASIDLQVELADQRRPFGSRRDRARRHVLPACSIAARPRHWRYAVAPLRWSERSAIPCSAGR